MLIIVGLPVVFGLAGWTAVKLWPKRGRERGSIHACPHCHRQGKISLFGTYQCSSCGNVFYVTAAGKDVSSLLRALTGMLVTVAIFGSALVGVDLYLGHSWWESGTYWLEMLTPLSYAIPRKKFPAA